MVFGTRCSQSQQSTMPRATPAEFQQLRSVKVLALRASEERRLAEREHARSVSTGFSSAADDFELERAIEWETSTKDYARDVTSSVIDAVNAHAIRSRDGNRRAGGTSTGRRRGSRRCGSSSRTSSDDPPGGDPEPARGRLYERLTLQAGRCSAMTRTIAQRAVLRFSSPVLPVTRSQLDRTHWAARGRERNEAVGG